MDFASLQKLRQKTWIRVILTFIILPAALMLSAGTVNYWEGWLFSAVVLLPVLFVVIYFFKKSPEFLERRMQYREKEPQQKVIVAVTSVLYLIGFLLPGIDHRFGWSTVPWWVVIIANTLVFASYVLIFLVFKENAYAGRTIQVVKGQKVIDTGPYAIIRHPMYVGVIIMSLSIPLALGSWWALIPFLEVCAMMIVRILNEESVLQRDLPGYTAYCEKVHYRLIPFIW